MLAQRHSSWKARNGLELRPWDSQFWAVAPSVTPSTSPPCWTHSQKRTSLPSCGGLWKWRHLPALLGMTAESKTGMSGEGGVLDSQTVGGLETSLETLFASFFKNR